MEQARVEWIGESWDMVHASDEEEITYVDKEKCGFAWGGNALSFGYSAGRSQWTWTVALGT